MIFYYYCMCTLLVFFINNLKICKIRLLKKRYNIYNKIMGGCGGRPSLDKYKIAFTDEEMKVLERKFSELAKNGS